MQPESTQLRLAKALPEYKQTAPKEIQPVSYIVSANEIWSVSGERIKEGCSKKVIDAI